MKNLKKVFLICLFSFLFIVNVNAAEVDISYRDNIKTFTQTYKTLLDNVAQYLRDNATSIDQYHSSTNDVNITNDKNVIVYLNQNISGGTVQIGILKNRNDTSKTSNANFSSGGRLTLFYYKYTLRYNTSTYAITGIVSRNSSSTSSQISTYYNDEVFEDLYIDWRLGANTDTKFYNNDSDTYIINKDGTKSTSGTWFTGGLYGFANALNNGFKEILYNKGTYNNSNVLTYKIKDGKSGTNKELKIKFTFLNQLDVNSNDITIYKYGSQVYTQYSGTTCSNVDNDSVCEFNLKYDVYSSNTDKLMFDFKFNNSYNVKVEDNSGSNGIYSNYKDVEFEYKLLDFSKMSGAIFYLRNYDNFEYMKDYLYNVEYNFGIWPCKDYGSFKGAITYGNDIEYKNNYIYKDVDNFYKFDNGTYIKINNLGMDSYDFIFDSSLLSDNKFSSFVIRNRNYLGSLDTDNLPLYVYYNSSLFNYNKLDFSTNVNNGSTSNYVGTNQDFNFSVNGSQNSFDVGVSSGEVFDFDDDIKVYYKSGLQYFKDKIIDMFEFVSEFYNTMPNKFQVAFSLIFVLLIGIALFRLLL